MEDFWHQNYALLDLLLETNMSQAEIAKELDMTQAELCKKQKELGLDWIRRQDRKMSRGQAALTQIMKRLMPGVDVLNEYHIGERLMLDVYCPKFKLAAEYHGRQHFEFISRFHDTIHDFERSVERDQRKLELCEENGITLVVFRYNDALSEDFVCDRLITAMQQQPVATKARSRKKQSNKLRKSPLSVKGDPYYEQAKERRKEYEKEMRRKIKLERKSKK